MNDMSMMIKKPSDVKVPEVQNGVMNMEKMFSVNVYGAINMLQIVSRIMGRQEKGGSIVNIASMTALRGNQGQLVYSATKGAIVSLTKSAAKELAEKK